VHLYNTACNTHTHTYNIYTAAPPRSSSTLGDAAELQSTSGGIVCSIYIYKYKRGEGVILIVSYWCIYIRGRAGFEVNSAAAVCSGTGKGAAIGCKSTCDELCVCIYTTLLPPHGALRPPHRRERVV